MKTSCMKHWHKSKRTMTVIAALLVTCTCPPCTASSLCQQSIAASIQQSEWAAHLAPFILSRSSCWADSDWWQALSRSCPVRSLSSLSHVIQCSCMQFPLNTSLSQWGKGTWVECLGLRWGISTHQGDGSTGTVTWQTYRRNARSL